MDYKSSADIALQPQGPVGLGFVAIGGLHDCLKCEDWRNTRITDRVSVTRSGSRGARRALERVAKWTEN